MKAALVILLGLVIVGIVAWVLDRFLYKHFEHNSEIDENQQDSEQCCGMHIVCQKDSLSPVSEKPEYYDDEELDRFKGRSATDYDNSEIEEFRNVLLTLRSEDVAGWARSIQVRQIELPVVIRDELLMIVAERRESREKEKNEDR